MTVAETDSPALSDQDYAVFLSKIKNLLTESKIKAARSVNALLTATYWELGRRIVEYEQRR